MFRHLLVLVLAVALAGGGVLEPSVDSTTSTTTALVAEELPGNGLPEPTAAGDAPCLVGDRPFARDGVISAFGGANGDATQISGIRWAGHEGCERVVVDLLTADGAPASAIDPVGVDYDAKLGIIRINLPAAVARSAIADSRFDGDLVSRVYVVSTADGRVAIDLHIRPGAAIGLRAFEVDSPSRIVIDLRSDEGASAVVGPTTTSRAVLLSPLPGPAATTVLVTGYARGTQDTLTARVFSDPDRELLLSADIALTGDANLWREFASRLPVLPEQPLQLSVGFGGSEPADNTTIRIDTTVINMPDPPEV